MTTRDTKGRFLKGRSGNPNGKPFGAGNSPSAVIRREIAKHGDALVKQLIKSAKEGNQDALFWLLDRLVPKLKSEAAPIQIDLKGAAQEVADRLLTAVSEGNLAPETAGELLSLVRHSQIGTESVNFPTDAELDALYESAIRKAETEQQRIQDDINAGRRIGAPTH
ncbi:DUF5681 domain-containing protein [Halochromatium roseum]|uniref:DUF5681 domain-containing protein n=1 Tax=Halochromatium roseum TaxID=391920 RepID=UPI0019135854|nr:DUF5681 domain-containing protein [Halochromatium roseum]MBK5938132.1 hypothetical protein [Halochromatium roseum]